jgi:membrane protein
MPDAERSDAVGSTARRKLGRGFGHAWNLLYNGIDGLSQHRGTQLAASMGYYALFSVFPAVIVLASAAGFVLDDPTARQDVVDYLLRELPLSEESGRSDVEQVLDDVTANAGTLGLIGLAVLIITASALVSAARNSLSVIFGENIRRGALRGKAVDVLLVLALGLLVAVSFLASVVGQFEPDLSGSVGNWIQDVIDLAGSTVVPVLLTGLLFTVAFKVLPAVRRPLRDLWPGILFATLAYELVRRGFAWYLDTFANYSAIYGSVGVIIAFMFFVYLASLAFLLGAEMAAAWPGIRDDDGSDDGEGTPLGEEIKGFVKRLFTRNPVDP